MAAREELAGMLERIAESSVFLPETQKQLKCLAAELAALRAVAEAARSVADRADAFDDKRDTDGISMSLWRLRDLGKALAALDRVREGGGG